jgi:hypothetical protein
VTACASSLAGTSWALKSLCVTDDQLFNGADTKVQSVCASAYGQLVTPTVSGIVGFANGQMTLHVHASASKMYTLPNNCSFCQCSQMEAMLNSAGLYTATCSPQCSNGDCTCWVDGSIDDDVTEGYTGAGGKVTTSGGRTFDACAGATDLSMADSGSKPKTGSATFAKPSPEICDGIDNDANGKIDDNPVDRPSCKKVGACASVFTATCGSSGWTCKYASAAYEAQETKCDGIDNDCNGIVDDQAATDFACQTAKGDGFVCKNGACTCSKTLCNGACIDTQSDTANCGACGHACSGATPYCQSGQCTCPSPYTVCGNQCVPLDGSPDNCGACGNKCTGGTACAGGKCVCLGSNQQLCSGVCVTTGSDPQNCGGCGNVCTDIKQCVGGSCTCPSGTSDCGGVCKSLKTDSNNCGSCGNACTGGEQCSNGQCVCPSWLKDCGGTCVDTNSDANNCGSCGTTCSSDKMCAGGGCQCNYLASWVDCGGGVCVNLGTDPNNCGNCGVACTGGKICSSNFCQCPAGVADCGGTCADTKTDPAHCGSCNIACAPTQDCVSSACVCKTGLTLCGQSCVNVQTDSSNCGKCGQTCVGNKTCQAGVCK